MAESKIIHFRAGEATEQDLKKIMEEHRCNQSQAIRQAIVSYMRQIESK